jgi:hypothetical protein
MKQFLVAVFALAATAGHAQVSSERSADYLSGAGMGYAKAAELNHFPGPMHVLELADKLGLSAEQRATTKQLMDQHKRQARAIEEATLARAVRETAALEGEYRLSHLETHRRMRALLTEEQVKRYDELRGNTSVQPGHKHGH